MQLMLERWPASRRFPPETAVADPQNSSCAKHLHRGGRTQPARLGMVACFSLYAVFATGFWSTSCGG